MTNTYTHQFVAKCPNNQQAIFYTLVIETAGEVIMVESIVDACSKFIESYHESIADKLSQQFPGRQTITAHHHGVDIRTIREGVCESE